jgi:hypothetical protein
MCVAHQSFAALTKRVDTGCGGKKSVCSAGEVGKVQLQTVCH